MGLREIALDFSLLRQGLSIEHEFGAAAFAELVRVGRFLEHAFYESGSLCRTERGVTFVLLNPPLRMGAFGSARLLFDGVPVAAERSSFEVEGGGHSRPFSEIDPLHPMVLAPGQRVRFFMELDPPGPGRHEVRLELKSVAIPPLVWIEIFDTVRAGTDP
ncbi:MAG: hypothetical protein L3J95_04460 [Thermoplasmata archaeon]|nr:hypothetical protein [Thermoplasmata archaeon]MCI4359658.1 hypothetical protein [Thermoplasmata archaeon]